jgi:hypothetical protein
MQTFAPTSRGQNPAPLEGGGDTGYDYYFTEGLMSDSSGAVLVDAIYESDTAANQNTFTATLDGITLSLDLNTGQPGWVSDEDLDHLNAWVFSEEGQLVQQAAIALIQEEQQHPDNETLLIYCLVAMVMDSNPPFEASLDKSPRATFGNHHTIVTTRADRAPSQQLCWLSAIAPHSASPSLLGAFLPPVQACHGCCGSGCNCLLSRNYAVIQGGPCLTHDNCTRSHNNQPFHRDCLPSLASAVVYTIVRFFF